MTAQLFIIRHAIAAPPDAERWPDDGDRPLSPIGVRRARRAAVGLRRTVQRPDLLLTSPLQRARDTAALLTHKARWPQALLCGALAPQGTPEAVFEALSRYAGQSGCIALVGHQPLLGRLISACLHGEPSPEAFELKKNAAAGLTFADAPRAGTGTLTWLLPPRVLRNCRPAITRR